MHSTTPSRWRALTMLGAIRRQARRALICPDEPRLHGKLALVTGGNGGIGYETCRGLLARGAEVIMASRDPERAEGACARLRSGAGPGAEVSSVRLALDDLESVYRAAQTLRDQLEGRAIDVLVANAGVWLRSPQVSAQGHELSFATNVLGHHLLVRLLQDRMAPGGRVIVLTGDIYCLARACTPDYRWRGRVGGMLAYCRSKLGNLWLASELQRRAPELLVVAVHPGVVESNLGRRERGEGGQGRGPLIDCARGAQLSLYCATAQGLVPGGYYHNTLGLMRLRPSDPARDAQAARRLWETCERLCADWLPRV